MRKLALSLILATAMVSTANAGAVPFESFRENQCDNALIQGECFNLRTEVPSRYVTYGCHKRNRNRIDTRITLRYGATGNLMHVEHFSKADKLDGFTFRLEQDWYNGKQQRRSGMELERQPKTG